jgi:hypothetical protein
MALQVDRQALEMFATLTGEEYRRAMRERCWANLPVLNEWKRRFPGEDPVRLHARLWQVDLRCPDGGRYVWNDEFQTMESTVHGCPARPKVGPATAPALQPVDRLNLGVTFEPEQRGLRARAVLHRPAEQPESQE